MICRSDCIVFFEIPPRLLPPLVVCLRSIGCDFDYLYFLCQLDADQGSVQFEFQEESTEACTVFIKAAERGSSHILIGVKSLGFEYCLDRHMCCMLVGRRVCSDYRCRTYTRYFQWGLELRAVPTHNRVELWYPLSLLCGQSHVH